MLLTTAGSSLGQDRLYGVTFFNNELISFDLVTGDASQVGFLGAGVSPYGIANRGGALYTFDPNADRIRQIDPNTGTVTGAPINIGVGNLLGEGDLVFRADGMGFLSNALAADLTQANDLFSFNLLAGTSTRLGTTGVTIDALAFSPSGVLFALGQGEGRLFTVNQTNGATTVVGELGVPQDSSFAGLTFAPNGTLYATIDDALYTLNVATGAATPVNAFGTNFGAISGLAFGPVPEPTTTAMLAVGVLALIRRRRG